MYEVRTDASHLKAFHTACRLLDVFCLSKSKNIDFRDIRYESVDRRQFQTFCRSVFNPVVPRFKGRVDGFFFHLSGPVCTLDLMVWFRTLSEVHSVSEMNSMIKGAQNARTPSEHR
ncbi:hypothetical protein T06_975 [Trichinella sp. T6]|nr:hypothetical protein T06_975 [Trichinella sp. T6]